MGRAGEPRHLPDALRPGRDEASATRGGPPSAAESAPCARRPAPCAPRPASPARARPRRALRPCASATSRTRALPVSPAAFAKYKTRNSNLNTPSPGCGPWPREARGRAAARPGTRGAPPPGGQPPPPPHLTPRAPGLGRAGRRGSRGPLGPTAHHSLREQERGYGERDASQSQPQSHVRGHNLSCSGHLRIQDKQGHRAANLNRDPARISTSVPAEPL